MPMITVLYFAALRDRVGCERDLVEMPDETTAEAVLQELARLRPVAADLFNRSRLAVDLAFVSGPLRLHAHSEVAVIPPVSGG